MSKRRRRIFGALAAVAVILIGFLILFDWNWLKGPLESQVAGRLGRPLLIHGDLDVELSLQPKIIVESAELGNAPWGSDAPMAKIDRAEVTVDLLKLLRGEIVLPEVRIAKPALLLETRPDGPPNWQFGATKKLHGGRRPCRGSAGWRSAIRGFATTISAADGTSPPSCRASLATPTPPSS